MKTLSKGILALLVVGVVGYLVLTSGYNPISSKGGTTTIGSLTDTPPITSATGQLYNGDLGVTTEGRDSNDPAITYSGATDYNIICYERIGNDVKDWEVLDGGDDSTTEAMTVPIRKTTGSDAGITEMWCEVSAEIGGQQLYIDKDGTISANSVIASAIYEDPDLDQTPSWVFQVNLLDISTPDPNNPPTMNLRLKFMEEAVSANFDQTVLSVASAGTGNHENRIKNDLDFVTTSDSNDSGAIALSQIQVKLNSTNDETWDENASYIEVPNGNSIQRIKLSQMDRIDLTSTTTYKFKYGNDIATANLIVVQKSGDPEVDTPFILFSNFSVPDSALCVETEFKYVDSFNAFSTTTNDVEVAEGLVGDECVL